jgi:hypothetical protein
MREWGRDDECCDRMEEGGKRRREISGYLLTAQRISIFMTARIPNLNEQAI